MRHAQEARSGAFEVEALVAGANVTRLAEQARAWRPRLAVVSDERKLPELRERLAAWHRGPAAGEAAAVIEAAGRLADWIMAIVGVAGLRPTWAAARSGAVVGLANKESLVVEGRAALLDAARQAGGVVIPVESEHSAIFQVLNEACAGRLRRTLIASGGPFRLELRGTAVTLNAVAHPNWSMGPKISQGQRHHHGQQGLET